MHDLALRAVALAAFLAIVAGGVYAAEQAFGTETTALQLSTPTPELSAAPGTEATFEVHVRNPTDQPHVAHVYVAEGAPLPSTVEPEEIELAPGANGTFRVTFDLADVTTEVGQLVLPVRGDADGAPMGTLRLRLNVATPRDLGLTPLQDQASAAPGWLVSFPVQVSNRGDVDADVRLDVPVDVAPPRLRAVAPEVLRVPAGGEAGAFVTLDLTGASPGTLEVPLQASVGPRALATATLRIEVQAPAQPAREGDTAVVDYVGRFGNGTFFDTSVQAVGQGPFRGPPGFARAFEPLSVQLVPGGGTIEGFWSGIVGMGEGQRRTLVLPPEEGYGNATEVIEVPRHQEVPRVSEPMERVRTVPRAVVAQFVNESSEVGDNITIEDQSGNVRVYRITALDERNVTLRWEIAEGDTFTVHALWPGQSVAHEVTDTSVTFRTTPADPGQPFTYFEFWPGAARVASMDESVIVVEHSPAEGLDFEIPGQRGPVPARVVGLTDTLIRIETPNQHPLAGETLWFDITLHELRPGQAQQG